MRKNYIGRKAGQKNAGNIFFIIVLCVVSGLPVTSFASYRFSDFQATPPIHVLSGSASAASGLSPARVRAAYGLPSSGGHGTIALIDAYNDTTIESDLATFDAQFGLPACTTKNGCFEQHFMQSGIKTSGGWNTETSLDVEWAHAIAPQAKILLVEAKTQSGANLVSAVDYARNRPDVTAISMSWGGPESSDEATLDSHFISSHGAVFFASSGDDGTGASWPAASPNVVAVGGTTLHFTNKGVFSSETAWSGSGGGVSAYEKEPAYQKAYSIPKAGGMRSIPDVSFNADPNSGYAVFEGGAAGRWYVVGGTSASSPIWAAIQSLGLSATNAKLYADKSSTSSTSDFRDITSGSNGLCGYYCTARARYDYVTGLGSPLTTHF